MSIPCVQSTGKTNRSTPRAVIAQNLVAHLKSWAYRPGKARDRAIRALSSPESRAATSRPQKLIRVSSRSVNQSVFAQKSTFASVAAQPCVICGRTPAHAHHIRYAQPRGVALKVSDEFTVPLCAIHHSENHATGDERRWWQERKIDPLAVAQQLWAQSRAEAEGPLRAK